MNQIKLFPKNTLSASFLLIFLVFLVYSNSFNSSWHLDDYGNITNNANIHLTQITPESIYRATHSNNLVNFYRPIACLTFAFNWYFGGSDVWGYHLVNTLIHAANAILLYLVVYHLLSTPKVSLANNNQKIFIALLTASTWACHPIQVQAVTYIVQRMASIATLFYLASLLCYLYARLNHFSRTEIKFFFYSFIFFLFAYGSKENAALLPLSLILTEIIFFQIRPIFKNKKKKFIFIVLSLAVATLSLFVLLNTTSYFNSSGRTFTTMERFLTQPRVICLYLNQILFPSPQKLSIIHDINISTSFFSPITTFVSFIILTFPLLFSLIYYKKYPIVSFAILFYFANHLIESTIIPLEIIFEHRNYLPSLFLFFPLAFLASHILYMEQPRFRLLKPILYISVPLLVITLGLGTLSRNTAWVSERTLWADAMEKAPFSARPAHNLAWGYYSKIGDIDTAISLYKKAVTLKEETIARPSVAYSNLGELYFEKKKYKQAFQAWEKAIEILPKYWKPHYGICKIYITQGKWEKALAWTEESFRNGVISTTILFAKGLINLHLNQPEEAITTFQQLLHNSSFGHSSRIGLGLAFLMQKKYKAAHISFQLAHIKKPKKLKPLLGLIAVETALGNTDTTHTYIDKILKIRSQEQLFKEMQYIFASNTSLPFPEELIKQPITKYLLHESIEFQKRLLVGK